MWARRASSMSLSKAILMVLMLASVSLAHLAGGEDQNIDGYIADFGHEPENIMALRPAVISVLLGNESTEQAAGVTEVWVRISSPKDVVFAGTFDAENGGSSFSYTFPEPGLYEITARYESNGTTLLQTNFGLEVEGFDWTPALAIIFFLIGIAASAVVMKKRSRKP